MERLLPRRDDQVFQLSLTEAAFTIAFLLLLIAGLLVAKFERERFAAAQALEALQDELAQARAKDSALDDLLRELRRETQPGGIPNLDERLSELVKRAGAQAQAEHLRARVDLLTRRLAALESLRALLERIGAAGDDRIARERLDSALRALQGIESAAGAALPAGKELETAMQLVRDAERLRQALAENANLRGQMAFMQRQAGANERKSGFGLPPCWLDAAGRVQRIVDVTITDHGLSVRPAWPPERAGEAAAAGIGHLLAQGETLDLVVFRRGAQPLYDWSRTRTPECRHYAQVFVSASKVEAAVRGKNTVYEFFYPAGQELLTGAR